MKIGTLTDAQNSFSYRDQRFSEEKFIIGIRDERYEHNVQTLCLYDNKNLIDLDEYEFGNNLFAAKPPYNNPKKIADLPLSRFYHNQLIKIDSGTIVENIGVEKDFMPKIKTFNVNINSFDKNSFFEFFEGTLDENKSLFHPKSSYAFELIKNLYLEDDHNFFVIQDNRVIGPFIAQKVSETSFKVSKGNAIKFGEYEHSEKTYIEFEANRIQRKVYIASNQLNLQYKKEITFISDDELLKTFEQELNNYPEMFDENSLINLKKVLSTNSGISTSKAANHLTERLENILSKNINILSTNIKLINLIPDVKKIKEDKIKAEEEIFNLRRDREELILENQKIAEEIQNLEELKAQNLESQKNEIQSEILVLQEKKQNLEWETEEKRRNLEQSLEQTKQDISFYDRTKTELMQQIDVLREEFKEEQKKAQISLQNLIKSKIHFDFISGRDLSENNVSSQKFADYQITDKYSSAQYRDFRNELMSILKQCNRNFETHFIDNLLISIMQNKLTIFAGVPGTGKTTLARLIGQILSHKDRVKEVSVSKGWTSQKDLIGFVNPLTKKFHSSSTEIYTLLKQMDYESQSSDVYLNTPIAFIILDEANLSPLEHYWSSFYNLTDSLGKLQLKLGNEETLCYQGNIRFIGTINHDHTTEELSPRVLDRVNIIQLPRTDEITIGNINIEDIHKIQLSFKRCIDFFELDPQAIADIRLDKETEKNYREIKTEFENLKIYISPRVEIAVKRYVTLANKYMSDVNKPLDYCVAQRILPLINLQGNDNKEKLESLKAKLKNAKLEISAKLVEKIIAIGSEKGIYEDNFNYFLTISNA